MPLSSNARYGFTLGMIVTCLLLIYSFQGSVDHESIKHYASKVVPSMVSSGTGASNPDGLAYVTLMTGTMTNASDVDINHDDYFVATRLLGYQLMHANTTRTARGIPFVVMVTDKVPQAMRDRLARDGAQVVLVDEVHVDAWVKGEMPQWADVMTKLRAWQLTQFSRVLLLDGDMILLKPIDAAFDDLAAQSAPSNPNAASPAPADEGVVPAEYVMASMPEANPLHAYPPSRENKGFKDPDYFNAGFFVLAPSDEMFAHYTAVLAQEKRFSPRYPEQNLLNYVHRRDGPMPWQDMDLAWNIRFPNKNDVKGGVASLHDKWWSAHMDKGLQPLYTSLRWQMEGYYEAMDAIKEQRA